MLFPQQRSRVRADLRKCCSLSTGCSGSTQSSGQGQALYSSSSMRLSFVRGDDITLLPGPTKAACVFLVTGLHFLPCFLLPQVWGRFSPLSECQQRGCIPLALWGLGDGEGLFPALAGCAALFQDQKDEDFETQKQ